MKKEKIQIISLSAAPRFLDYNSTQTKNLQDQAGKIDKYILVNFQRTKFKIQKVDNILFIEVPRLKSLFYIKQIVKTIKQYLNPEIKTVITAGNPFDLGLIGILLKLILRFPLQLQVHMDLYSKHFLKSKKRHYIYFLISKIGFLFTDSIRTVSKNTEKILRTKYPNKPIKNIIEIADFSDIPVTVDRNDNGILYLSPSRYDEQKNLFNLIDAFILFHRDFPNTRLRIIGRGPLEEKLKDTILKNNADKYIELSGWSTDMPNEYTKANFSILSSIFEGYSMAVIESLRYGTPFLATPVTGSTELIINGENGYLAIGFDVKDIYDLLVKSYENKNKFNNEKIKESVKDFTKDAMDREMIDLWKKTS